MIDKVLANLKKLLVNTDPKIDDSTVDQADPMRRVELRVMSLFEWLVAKLRKSAEDADEVRSLTIELDKQRTRQRQIEF